jgi:hypothetical protein
MWSAQKIQPYTRSVYQRGTVECQKCKSPIHVYKVNAIADEYSVLCRRCGHRGVYLKRFLHVDDLPERRKKPRQ